MTWFDICKAYCKSIDNAPECEFQCEETACCNPCPYLYNGKISCGIVLTTKQWKYEFKQWVKEHPAPKIQVNLTLQQLCELDNDAYGTLSARNVILDILKQTDENRKLCRRANEILNDESITEDDRYRGGDDDD